MTANPHSAFPLVAPPADFIRNKGVILLDMDETLCATSLGDEAAILDFAELLKSHFELNPTQALELSSDYRDAIYARRKIALSPETYDNEQERRARLLQAVFRNSLGSNSPDWSQIQELESTFMSLRMKHFDFFPGVKDLLAQWRTHHPLAVVTNGSTYSQWPKLERVAMTEHVDLIIVAGELGLNKPDPAIFRHTLEKLNCSVHDCVFIGDDPRADIAGANNMKMDSIWISAGQTWPDNVDYSPTFQVPVITDLHFLQH